jgi:homoserine kinase type II
MPKGGAHFSSEELAQVLSHYEIGVIHHVKALTAGDRRAPKMIVTSEQGKFLVKRRPKGKDDLYRVAFAHAVQVELAGKGFPVTALIPTRDENNTILQLQNHIYEFFGFVTGLRYDQSAEATVDTGRQLANFHRYLADFASQWMPLRTSFHDSSAVRRHLKMIEADKSGPNKKDLQKTIEKLMSLYNNSSVCVNQLGFDSWPQQVIHGDWHPGNMLFDKGRLIAVFDFDSVKIAPPVTDLANGMLQFSIVGNRPNPIDWPDYIDQAKLIQFFSGYQEIIRLDKNQMYSLVDLMIETIIAEAVVPIVATGSFGNLTGADFLKMIKRKARWLNKNRKMLTEAMEGCRHFGNE